MHIKVHLFSAQNAAIRELTPPLNVQSDSFKQNYLNDTAYLIKKYVNLEQFNILTAKQSEYFPYETGRCLSQCI